MTVQSRLLHEDLSYKIRGCVFKVYNSLGFGHKESVYHKALTTEFNKRHINFEQEKSLDIFYENEKVGNYRPDFVIEGKIIIEIKAQDFLIKDNERQVINYLKSTNYQLAFLVNFGGSKLDIRRLVWTPNYLRKSAMISENQ